MNKLKAAAVAASIYAGVAVSAVLCFLLLLILAIIYVPRVMWRFITRKPFESFVEFLAAVLHLDAFDGLEDPYL